MKNNLIKILSYTLFFIVLTSFTNTDKHIGKWSIEESEKHIGFMIFDKEGYVTFEMDGKKIGGKESEMKGMIVQATYTVNYKTTPHQIDIYITEKQTEKQLEHVRGIFEFTDSDQMRMNGVDRKEKERPKDFEGNDILIMTKVNN